VASAVSSSTHWSISLIRYVLRVAGRRGPRRRGRDGTQITVDDTGSHNQEFAPHGTPEIESERGTLASLDTDGTNGKSDAASGIIVAKLVAERRGPGNTRERQRDDRPRGPPRCRPDDPDGHERPDLYVVVVTETDEEWT
jgi:hypothetical protein